MKETLQLIKEDFEEIFKEAMEYIEIKDNTISFTFQNNPIKEVGVNGCQIEMLGQVWVNAIIHLNAQHPCLENAETIKSIKEALEWQKLRTQDRIERKVEGFNKA